MSPRRRAEEKIKWPFQTLCKLAVGEQKTARKCSSEEILGNIFYGVADSGRRKLSGCPKHELVVSKPPDVENRRTD